MKKYLPGISLIGFLVLLSCEKMDPGADNKSAKSGYEITLSGTNDIVLVGKNVNTNWDEEDSWLYLGADENLEPLGTLTMQLAVPSYSNDPIQVISAIQSKTDVRVGTAMELNARNYVIREPSEDFPVVRAEITDWEIGVNYIKGTLYMDMERQLIYSTDESEFVTLTGTFTAIN